MTPRICVVTAGHLSTSPRMLKAADALHEAGYGVRVVCTNFVPWAAVADTDLRRTRPWPVTVVDYDRTSAPLTYFRSGVRFHAARQFAGLVGPARVPLAVAELALSRVHSELLRAVLEEHADFVYGGTVGGIAVAAAAARRLHIPYALDLEDFYSAAQDASPTGTLVDGLAGCVENNILRGAAFLTAAGAAVAAAYDDKYGVTSIAVNNVFPLPTQPPDLTVDPRPGLRLYWFSQTIGPRRGLDDAVQAVGLAAIPAELHLRGNPNSEYLAILRQLAARVAPQLQIIHHPPALPGEMFILMRGYDVGLALEPGFSKNNNIALSNKALSYLLGGLAVLLTDTIGQRPLAVEVGEAARICPAGDVVMMAGALKDWAENKVHLAHARQAAWAAARRRWHWEHPLERGAMLAAVARMSSKSEAACGSR